jgi:hypothetical protein
MWEANPMARSMKTSLTSFQCEATAANLMSGCGVSWETNPTSFPCEATSRCEALPRIRFAAVLRSVNSRKQKKTSWEGAKFAPLRTKFAKQVEQATLRATCLVLQTRILLSRGSSNEPWGTRHLDDCVAHKTSVRSITQRNFAEQALL